MWIYLQQHPAAWKAGLSVLGFIAIWLLVRKQQSLHKEKDSWERCARTRLSTENIGEANVLASQCGLLAGVSTLGIFTILVALGGMWLWK